MAIDTKGAAWSEHEEIFKLPKTVLAGTKAMVDACLATKDKPMSYLPKGKLEPEWSYERRLGMGAVEDDYERTLNYLTGQVFREPPKIDNPSQAFKELFEDVDKRGNNLPTFAQECFHAGLHAGVSFIYADYSSVKTVETDAGPMYEDAEGNLRPRTLAAAKANNWGPYWVLIRADQVVDAWYSMESGKRRLVHFRYKESVTEQKDEWSREPVEQIRVLTPGKWAVYRKVRTKEGAESWEEAESGVTTMPEIPIAMFRPGQPMGEITARPALLGLAEMVRKAWRKAIGIENMDDYLQRPIIFGSGLSYEENYEIPSSPGAGVHTSTVGAELKAVNVIPPEAFVATTGHFKDLKAEMGSYGLKLMAPKSGAVTAAQILREASENDSALKRWASAMEDCLENALKFTAQWFGEKDPSIAVNKEYTQVVDPDELAAIREAVKDRTLPKRVQFEEFKRRGVVPSASDLDWESAQSEIEDEARAGGSVLSAQTIASARLGPTQTQV